MSWLPRFFRRSRLYDDLAHEIRQHLEEKAEELEAEGMPREQAIETARREFGNVALTMERGRDAWGWRWVEDFFADLRFGYRQLRRNPVLAAVCVLTLALGIGANVAIFSAIDAVLLRPLPFKDADRLVMICEFKAGNVGKTGSPFVRYRERAAHSDVFEESGGYWDVSGGDEAVFGDENRAERVRFSIVTDRFFPLLGVQPALGRGFSDAENAPGGPKSFLASYAFWIKQLGGERAAVGRNFRIDGVAHTLIGVLPAEFRFPEKCDIWLPMSVFGAGIVRDRVSHQFWMIGRLRPGIGVERTQAEMGLIQSRLAKTYPDSDANWGVVVRPLLEELVGNVRRLLWALLAAVGFVLLIACTNVVNLLLARAVSRQREFAIRAAIGAGRLRLLRQALAESLLLATAGAALALLVGELCLDAFARLGAGSIPRFENPQLNAAALGFCCALALLTTLAVGIAPGLGASAAGWGDSLAPGERSGLVSPRSAALRNVLVISEVALTMLLVSGAGLMLRSLAQLRSVDPGFHPEHLVTMKIALPDALYPNMDQRTTFLRQALERLNSTPGISIAAATDRLPLSGERNWGSINVVGRPVLDSAHAPSIESRGVSAGYFRALGIPLLRGRFFTDADVAQQRRVMVLNQAAADQFWPGADPIGQQISGAYHDSEPREIIGVVGNVRELGLDTPSPPEMYYPYQWWNTMNLVIRAETDPAALAGTVRREIAELDRQVPVYDVTSMEDVVSHSVARLHFESLLFGAFAAVALALAAVGIYGLMAFTVNRRTPEIGLRIALGAQPSRVMALIVSQGMKLVLAGAAAGIVMSLALDRLLRDLLFELSPADPLTLVADILLVAAMGALASAVPAWRAMRVDPMVALRAE